MSMFNMFSSCFIWLLCILLIAVSFIYLSQKISEQNHKMSSMIGLISSMAEELQHSKKDIKSSHPVIELSELINVSDGEGDEPEADEDDEDDDDDDDDDGDDDDDDDADDEDDDDDDDEDENDDIRIINITDICNISNINIDAILDVDDINIDAILDVGDIDVDVGDIGVEDIHIVNNITDISDGELIKSINIKESLEEKINYKKMKIDQLKTMVTDKGLGDTLQIAKLKKDDLIKLLSE